jgi:hypothetical protein
MKSFFVIIASLFLLFSSVGETLAQMKVKPLQTPPMQVTPKGPTFVAIDAPPAGPPSLGLNVSELKFGSQGVGVESCMYVTITNTTQSVVSLSTIYTDDQTAYTIPSPAQKMLPMNIQPKVPLKISVCFKPQKVGEYKSHLTIKTTKDSVTIPINGKGIKPEDVAKLPKTDLIVTKGKKKGNWNIKLQLVTPAKITLQLFDDLGVMQAAFLNGDFKNEGVYEIPFDGLDKAKQKLPAGKYYLRCVIEDIARGSTPTKFTKVITIG